MVQENRKFSPSLRSSHLDLIRLPGQSWTCKPEDFVFHIWHFTLHCYSGYLFFEQDVSKDLSPRTQQRFQSEKNALPKRVRHPRKCITLTAHLDLNRFECQGLAWKLRMWKCFHHLGSKEDGSWSFSFPFSSCGKGGVVSSKGFVTYNFDINIVQ